jgi:hypothetical protein
MKIRELLTWKTVKFIAVTILLGALGSGLWEWLLKPALTGTSDVVLNIATLGFDKFKGSLYQEIAFGFREEPSLRVFSVLYGLLPCFLIGLGTGMFFAHSRLKSAGNSSSVAAKKIIDLMLKPLLLVTTFLLVFSIVQASQVAYINRAITHFNQLSSIAAPYLSEQQRLMSRSEFARISSKADYERVIADLRSVCMKNGVKPPEFFVW